MHAFRWCRNSHILPVCEDSRFTFLIIWSYLYDDALANAGILKQINMWLCVTQFWGIFYTHILLLLLLLAFTTHLRVLASSFWRFRDHTQWHTIVGRTPLDEWSARRRDLYLTNTQHSQQTNIHAPGGIGTRNPSRRAAADPRIRPFGRWDRQMNHCWGSRNTVKDESKVFPLQAEVAQGVAVG
jgi:hypothetical protein